MIVEVVTDRDIFAECVGKLAQRDVVLDLGGRARFYKRLAPWASRFRKVRYWCLDIRDVLRPDVVGDLLSLPFPSAVADGVICHAVLEHVYEPQTAVREIHRVLKEGGAAFLYVPFLYPYHGSPGEPDCWRFTKDGLLCLFRESSRLQLQPVDSYIGVVLRFVGGFTRLERLLIPLARPVEWLVNRLRSRPLSRDAQASGYNIWVEK